MAEVPDDVLRALLAEPAERFVAARTERVKALRAEGHKEEAADVAKLRKPSRMVFALADLARRDDGAAAAAVQAATEVEAAQAGHGDLRDAMAALRPAIEAVLATAPVGDRVDLEVPLRTLLADEEGRAAWLDGFLVDLPGSGAGGAIGAAPGRHLRLVPSASESAASHPPSPTSRRHGGAGAGADRNVARQQVEAARAEAQEQAARAAARHAMEEAVTDAGIEVEAAEQAAEALDDALARAEQERNDLRDDLARVEGEVALAQREADDAEKRRASARQALDAARAALHADGPTSGPRSRRPRGGR
ncbi:MAG: hypothetical protein ACR2MB_11100 [Acidimicrobiales bacterium]